MSHKLIDKLSDLSDVSGAPSDGEVLTYVASSSDWQAVAASGGGGGTEQFIQYNITPASDYRQELVSANTTTGRVVKVDTIRSSGVFPAGTYRFHYRVSTRSAVAKQFSGMSGGSKADGYQYNFLSGGNILSNGTNTTVYNVAEALGGGHYWDPTSYCIEKQNSKGYTQTIGLDFIFTAGDTFSEFEVGTVFGTGHPYYSSYAGTLSYKTGEHSSISGLSELLIVTKL